MLIQEALGKILSEERQKQGLSQLLLSEKAALHLNTIQGIEAGRYNAKVSTVYQICHALDIPIADVMAALENAQPDLPEDNY